MESVFGQLDMTREWWIDRTNYQWTIQINIVKMLIVWSKKCSQILCRISTTYLYILRAWSVCLGNDCQLEGQTSGQNQKNPPNSLPSSKGNRMFLSVVSLIKVALEMLCEWWIIQFWSTIHEISLRNIETDCTSSNRQWKLGWGDV